MKGQHTSPLQPAALQKILKDIADKRFVDATGNNNIDLEKIYERKGLSATQVNLFLSYISVFLSIMMMQFEISCM